MSHGLTDRQVAGLIAAATRAFAMGRVFQRHWCVHYGRAGIEPHDGTRFISHLFDMVGKQARREGGELTVIWVRECASDKGEHLHALMHLPPSQTLTGRTRRWIERAGGTWGGGISRVMPVGGRINRSGIDPEGHYRANAENVVRYLLKAGSSETGDRLGLTRAGVGGPIVGKRCGWSQNLK